MPDERPRGRQPPSAPDRGADRSGRSHLAAVQRLVLRTGLDAAAQARVIEAASRRIAEWRDRGASFEPLRTKRPVSRRIEKDRQV